MTAQLVRYAATRPVVAVFDFDGTLTDRHTFWRYLKLLATAEVFWPAVARLTPDIARIAAGKEALMVGRDKLIARTIAGIPDEHARLLAVHFARVQLPKWIRPAALSRLRWHQARGHRTVLLSNSAEHYLVPWGESVDFDDVLGSRLEVEGGRLTGRLSGKSCVGPEKVARLRKLLGCLSRYTIFAYGDSSGDRELLQAADYPFYRTWDFTHETSIARALCAAPSL